MMALIRAIRAQRGEVALAALILGAFLAWLLLRPGARSLFIAGDNFGLLTSLLVAAALCLWNRGGSRPRSAQQQRHPTPLLLGLGLISQATGAATWLFYAAVLHRDVPFPSLADVGWLGGYPFWVLAILLLPRRALSRTTRARLLLDGLLLIAAIATVSWYFVLGPLIVAGTATPFATIVNVAYPFSDLLLLSCVLLFLGRGEDPRLRPVVRLFTLGAVSLVAADSLYDYKVLHGIYTPGDLLDSGWVLAYLLLGLGGRALRRVQAAPREEPAEETNAAGISAIDDAAATSVWRALFPYALMPALGALIVYSRSSAGDRRVDLGLSIGVGTLLGLVVLHQALVVLENRRLYAHLRTTHAGTVVANRLLTGANTRLEDLWLRATTDPLTGLPNHRTMIAQLDQELERAHRYRRPCALFVLDLDHFKAVNDAYGHAAGDAVLRGLAAVVRAALRGVDTFSRWGGEEFVALLPETGATEARAVAERVRAHVAAHLFAVGGGIRLGCSIGVATYPADAEERDDLVAAADRALYAAKRLGRNQVRASIEPAVAALGGAPGTEGSREDAALTGTVEALAALVDVRDRHTGQCTPGIGAWTRRLALALGLRADEARTIGMAARLRDIGKVAIPEAVLLNAGRLAEADWAAVRRHPVVGAEVVSLAPALRALAPLIRGHHERWDGAGYPDGLSGAAIPLGARIVAVADAFGAITSDRPYREGRDDAWALGELERCAGSQFDPAVVAALAGILEAERVGAVSLTAG